MSSMSVDVVAWSPGQSWLVAMGEDMWQHSPVVSKLSAVPPQYRMLAKQRHAEGRDVIN